MILSKLSTYCWQQLGPRIGVNVGDFIGIGDSSILRIGVNVGGFDDRQIVNPAYNRNGLYTDLQINHCRYYS